MLWFLNPERGEPAAIALAIVVSVLVFSLPVCFVLLFGWLKPGALRDLSLSPLFLTREEHEFHRNLRQRPQLNEDAFYETFYAESGIPKQWVTQLRTLLEDVSGYDLLCLNPNDNLVHLDGEMDFADVLYRVESDFKVKLDWEAFRRPEVTFDFLLRTTLKHISRDATTVAGAVTTDA